MDMTLRTLVFTAPSGRLFEIREQNGEDEEIITNPVDSKNLMNLTKYISAIVVKSFSTTRLPTVTLPAVFTSLFTSP